MEDDEIDKSTTTISNCESLLVELLEYEKSVKQIPQSFIKNNIQLDMKPILGMMSKTVSECIKLEDISKKIGKALIKITESMIPIGEIIWEALPKISTYFEGLSEVLSSLKDDPNSITNLYLYVEKLNEYFWTMPYQITNEELKDILENITTEKEFDHKMIIYFNRKKKNLFDDIENDLPRKHIVLFKQAKQSFDNGYYSLTNCALLSIIDELCSRFLFNKGNSKRNNLLEPIIEKLENENYNISLMLPLMILNENINTIYESSNFINKIEINTHKKTRRNLSQHGQSYSNKKIDSIMLLNTVYYILYVLKNYSKYTKKIIFVKNSKELVYANTKYSNDFPRFYLIKNYSNNNLSNQVKKIKN